MRTVPWRLTLLLLAVLSVLGAATANLPTWPKPPGIPHWMFPVALILLTLAFAYPLLALPWPVTAPLPADLPDGFAEVVDSWLAQDLSVRGLRLAAPVSMRWRTGDRSGTVRLPSEAATIEERMARWFDALPQRRVVLTGAAGAGKTVLAMRLALGLNRRREPGDPVAVPVSLADWRPRHEDLRSWLARRLSDDYELVEAAAAGLVRDRIIPVLDGLDELPPDSRTAALRGIRAALADGDPVVVTSRATEFDLANDGAPSLPHTTLVELEPLEPADAIAFLRRYEAGGRWDRVKVRLTDRPDSVLARVLSTPLAVWLAKTVYTGRNPDELTDTKRFDTTRRLTGHLVTNLIPAVYRRPARPTGLAPTMHRLIDTLLDPDVRYRVGPDRARRRLIFLAEHLNRLGDNEFQCSRLPEAVPAWRLRLSTALFMVIAAAITGVPLLRAGNGGLFAAQVLIGLVLGLAAGGRSPRRARSPGRGRIPQLPRPTGISLFRGVVVAVGLATVAIILGSVVIGFDDAASGRSGDEAVTAAVVVVLLVLPGFPVSMAAHSLSVFASPPPDRLDDRRPHRAWRPDLWVVFALIAIITTIAVTMDSGYSFGLGGDAIANPAAPFVIATVLLGALAGLAHGGSWFGFLTARFVLALTGRLPWRLFAFLEDARRRGVLRRSNASYRFRHALLREHLADPAWQEPPRSPSAARR